MYNHLQGDRLTQGSERPVECTPEDGGEQQERMALPVGRAIRHRLREERYQHQSSYLLG